MSSEFITIPPGLLKTWEGLQPNKTCASNEASETFGVRQFAIGRARRALSVNIGKRGRTRETDHETSANAFPILGVPRRSTRDETTVDPLDAASIRRPQRAATIMIGNLARPNITSHRNSPVSHLGISSAEQPAVREPQTAVVPDEAAQKSYEFQILDNCKFPSAAHGATVPRPGFVGGDSAFYSPEAGREGNLERRPDLRRTRSSRSWVLGFDVIRRASIAIEDAIDNLSSVTHLVL